MMYLLRKAMLLAFATTSFMIADVQAAIITNGGFESGFSGWTRTDQLGSEGTFWIQTGTLSPVNGDPVPAPTGNNAAMTDAAGPGSHVLYQTFTVSAPVGPTLLVFDLFLGNRAAAYSAPATLDFSTPTLNQQARVDILMGGVNPFSVAATDVLLNVFQTSIGSNLITGYTQRSVDVTALLNSHLNTPLTLRFAETDNVFTFQMGVDNVDFVANAQAVPEPSSCLITLGTLTGIWHAYRKRRRKQLSAGA